jgi:6-methylsalicylate decarboxylase
VTIDTHHHMLPDLFWQETENAHAPVGGLALLRWSKESTLSFMDDAGIDVAVLSVSTPGVHTGDSTKARTLARRCNEFAAELVGAKPDGFASFACIPLPDVDASLEELSPKMASARCRQGDQLREFTTERRSWIDAA